MKNSLINFILFMLLISSCSKGSSKKSSNSSQNVEITWLTQLGAETKVDGVVNPNLGKDSCSAITIDSIGNVYCAGDTEGNIGEENGGGKDVFVMKLNSFGNIVWVTQLGATTVANGQDSNFEDDYATDIVIDANGNIYVSGYTNGNMGESNGKNDGNTNSLSDAFVFKLNSSGQLQWLTQLGAVTKVNGDGSNQYNDYCIKIALDSSSNVYCSGHSAGAIGENGQVSTLSFDSFVLKLDSDGNLVWVKQFSDQSSEGSEKIHGLKIAASGNIYIGGMTTAVMGETSGGSDDIFIMKLNSNGEKVWTTQLGATTKLNENTNSGNVDYVYDLAIDSQENVYAAGRTSSNLGEPSGGGLDAYVLKLNSSGAIQWLTQLGDETFANGAGANSGRDECYGIELDAKGNIYCAGFTYGNMGENNGGNLKSDAFVFKLDMTGKLVWLKQFGAATEFNGNNSNELDDYCFDIAVSSIGSVYCAGKTTGNMGEANSGDNQGDAFVLRLN